MRTIIIIGILVGAAFAAGHFYMPSGEGQDTGVIEEESAEQMTEKTPVTPEEDESSVTVEASSLTDGQRKLLGALGIDADSITVTPEMMVCAEAKVGASRIEEIKSGDTPTFLEGLSLLGCYRK